MNFHHCPVDRQTAQRVSWTVESGQLSEGVRVKQFEQELKTKLGLRNPVCTNSGTSALQMGLLLAGARPGDEVILPPQTFIATGTVILQCGATPVFADVDPSTGNICPESVQKKVTRRTKAVIPVHWIGMPCEMAAFFFIPVSIVADAAQALGAVYSGSPLDRMATFTMYSFQATKHVTTGDGGVLCVPDKYVERARRLRWFGMDRELPPGPLGGREQDVEELGSKCLHAASLIRVSGKRGMQVMKMVKNRFDGEVESLGSDGKIVCRKVVGWHKTPRDGRRWVYLTHEYAQKRKGYRGKSAAYGDFRGVFLTEDHPVLTINGYIPAGLLTASDLLITANPDLTQNQLEFVTGSLLGDGCVTRDYSGGRGRNSSFSCTHSITQSEWIETKKKFLANFSGSLSEYETILKGVKYKSISYQGGSSPVWVKIRRRFYPEGIKVVPVDFTLEEMTDRCLASWYMDDGVLNGSSPNFCTDGFVKTDVNRLASMLRDKGYDAKVRLHQGKPRIVIWNPSARSFFSSIARFVVPSLRYKLPESFRTKIPYQPCLWEESKDEGARLTARPTVVFADPPENKYRNAYCVDVEETHNFIVGGDIVVHNCHMNDVAATIGIGSLQGFPDRLRRRQAIGRRYREELEGVRGVTLLRMPEYCTHAYYAFGMLVDRRDDFVQTLKEKGVPTSVICRRIDRYSILGGVRDDLPGMDEFDRKQINLPAHSELSDEDVTKVIEAVKGGW